MNAMSNIIDELKCPESKMRENVEMLSQGDTETEYRAEIHGIILFCSFLNVCWCQAEKSVKITIYRNAE